MPSPVALVVSIVGLFLDRPRTFAILGASLSGLTILLALAMIIFH